MQYHPSQQIPPKHTALYAAAVLQSLIDSPPLIGDLPESQSFDISALDKPPALSKNLHFGQKLGHLYEDAMAILLRDSTRFEVRAQSLQLCDANKRTLGELDFLLWDNTQNQHIHLELAVKLYLVHHTPSAVEFPGPDARDNYHKKLARMRSHQLQLSALPDAQATLLAHTHGHALSVQHLVHGIFFDHIAAHNKPTPEFASAHGRRATWLYCSEFVQYFPTLHRARVIPKQLWLCKIYPEIFDSLVTVPVPELLLLGQQRCTLFQLEPDTDGIFLVPDHWPQSD